MRLALVVGAWLLLAGCARAEGSPSQDASPAGSGCEVAIAAAGDAADADAAEGALEVAIAACPDIDAWQAATDRYASAFDELDPMAFLTDRCVNGPPDLAQTALCESLNVER